MPASPNGPEKIEGYRVDGTGFLKATTAAMKEIIEDRGGPDIGPTAPFLTWGEWEREYFTPEQIERLILMYKLSITVNVC